MGGQAGRDEANGTAPAGLDAATDDAAGRSGGAWLSAFGLAWLGGVASQLQQAALWPTAVYMAGGAVALLTALLLLAGVARRASARRAPSRAALAAFAAAAFVAGGCSAGGQAAWRLDDALPSTLEGVDLVLEGVVDGLPQPGPDGLRFGFLVDHAWPAARGASGRDGDSAVGNAGRDGDSAASDGGRGAVPRRVSLGWYRSGDDDRAAGVDARLGSVRAGERWRLPVRLRAPHGAANPHGFDFELWLFEQGVRAVGTVRDGSGASAVRLAAAQGHWIDRARQSVRDAIERQVDDPRAAGVLAALAIGDQAAIERSDWDLFRRTGVAHLMSISGLHVTMFAWLAGAAIGALWRRQPTARRWLPAPMAARWGGVAVAAGYALCAGWGVPAQRTVLMLAVTAGLQAAGGHWPWPLVLLAAAVAVTLGDPWALLQPGFWLSFAAVGLLMFGAPPGSGRSARHGLEPGEVDGAGDGPEREADRPGRARRLQGTAASAVREALRTQCVATVALAPLTLVCFQQLSLVGFAANLVAVPVVTLLITPLALMGIAMPVLWSAAALGVQALSSGLAALGAWPAASWTVAVAPTWAQALGLLGGALAVAPIAWRWRVLSVPLLLPLLVPVVERPPPGRYELVAADVGQGTAVLVRTAGHLLVYDAGPRYGRESDAGGRVLLPLLRARGEHRIDHLVLSHRDTDHVGGAAALMDALPVERFSSSLEEGHPLRAARPDAVRCEAGQRWVWDGVEFEVLHPRAEDYGRALKPNALSCVLQLRGPQGRVLLTGDIEREQELALVARQGEALRSDWLLAPHHGSRTSSSEALLEAVRPRAAIVQAGYRNRYGHPAPDVLGRYDAHAIMVIATPACGAFSWGLGPSRCHRVQQRRYWHHPLPPPSIPADPAGP